MTQIVLYLTVKESETHLWVQLCFLEKTEQSLFTSFEIATSHLRHNLFLSRYYKSHRYNDYCDYNTGQTNPLVFAITCEINKRALAV